MKMFTDEFVEGFDDLPKSEQKAFLIQVTKFAAFHAAIKTVKDAHPKP